jgi:hypothetical protein
VAWIDVTSPVDPFVEGLNTILVPRPQFFNSSVNHTLQNATDPEELPAYLAGLTFAGFDDSAAETTDAMVGVLNGTLRGQEALQLLEAFTIGVNGTVNGNWTVVTEHFVTLSHPERVVNAIPLEGVVFHETGDDPETGAHREGGGCILRSRSSSWTLLWLSSTPL